MLKSDFIHCLSVATIQEVSLPKFFLVVLLNSSIRATQKKNTHTHILCETQIHYNLQ